jgi:hypothetical protein
VIGVGVELEVAILDSQLIHFNDKILITKILNIKNIILYLKSLSDLSLIVYQDNFKIYYVFSK